MLEIETDSYAVRRPIFSDLAAPRFEMMRHRKYSENVAINHRESKQEQFFEHFCANTFSNKFSILLGAGRSELVQHVHADVRAVGAIKFWERNR